MSYDSDLAGLSADLYSQSAAGVPLADPAAVDGMLARLSALSGTEARRAGCMLGLACGDALGYPVEFVGRELMPPEYLDGTAMLPEPAMVSDDTQMSLATAMGLLDSATGHASPVDAVRARYLEWLTTQDDPSLVRAPGMTCTSALEDGGLGAPGSPRNRSKGCGGVMRAAPCGLLAGIGDADAYRLGAETAALTHGHPDGWHPAGVLAVAVRHLVSGEGRHSSIDAAMASGTIGHPAGGVFGTDSLWAEWSARASSCDPEAIGEGWVGDEALVMAFAALLSSGSYAECVRLAASVSGDSDSVACIAGAMAGARWGVGGLGVPLGWASRVESGPHLIAAALAFGMVRRSSW